MCPVLMWLGVGGLWSSGGGLGRGESTLGGMGVLRYGRGASPRQLGPRSIEGEPGPPGRSHTFGPVSA